MSLGLLTPAALDARAGLHFGAHVALVTDVADPDGQGRVRVKLPWAPDGGDDAYEAWARLATFMAGNNRGSWFVPDTGDEVLVVFEGGDPRRPYVVGSLWNGTDSPPESMDGSGENNLKVLRSRNGVRLVMDDTQGSEELIVETPGGHRVTLSDADRSVLIEDAAGNSVKLESSGITLTSSGTVKVQASTVDVSAGSVNVTAGISKFSGVVQADTVISNSVVGTSYTPGAGNMW